MSVLRAVAGSFVITGLAAMAPGEIVTWNPAADFSVLNGNPNGVWSYGTMPVGFGAFELMPSHTNSESPGWWAESSANIWRNNSTGTAYGVAPGQLSLHPGSSTQPCVLRWTAPADTPTTVYVRGRFFPGDSGEMLVQARVLGNVVMVSDYAPFDFYIWSVVPGQTIDFVVYGGYGSGNTPLEVTIWGEISGCSADFNQDGGIDGSDVDAFFAAWEGGDAGADVNEDGGVDGADVGTFFSQWEAGGC